MHSFDQLAWQAIGKMEFWLDRQDCEAAEVVARCRQIVAELNSQIDEAEEE